jgi:hypothetical protein
MCDKCNGTGIIITQIENDYTRFNTTAEYFLYLSFLTQAKVDDKKYLSVFCSCDCCRGKVRIYNLFKYKNIEVLKEENIISGGIR